VLERLAEESGETANLAVLVGSEVMNIEAVESPRLLMHVGWVGRRYPCHASAAGKVLLAWRDPKEVRELLPRRLPRLTPRTITSPAAFLQELRRVRERGYSTAWREMEDDLAAIGAPVRDHTGAVVSAITISAPASRAPLRALPALSIPVVRAARAVSEQLGYREGLVHELTTAS
jgi:DNA-binding IclR family transcriptional regulator